LWGGRKAVRFGWHRNTVDNGKGFLIKQPIEVPFRQVLWNTSLFLLAACFYLLGIKSSAVEADGDEPLSSETASNLECS
jgi:hypothetical protein